MVECSLGKGETLDSNPVMPLSLSAPATFGASMWVSAWAASSKGTVLSVQHGSEQIQG